MMSTSVGDPYPYGNNSTFHQMPNQTFVGNEGITVSSGGWNGTTISIDLLNNADFQKVQQRLTEIEKQLCILIPNELMQEKYPALQEAYDAYQLILKLVNDQKT